MDKDYLITYSLLIELIPKYNKGPKKTLINVSGTYYTTQPKTDMTTKKDTQIKIKELGTDIKYVIPKLLGDYSSISVGHTLVSDVPEGCDVKDVALAHRNAAVVLVADGFNEIATTLGIDQVFKTK